MAVSLSVDGPLVCVVGLGGVGSHCAHALVRAGLHQLRLVDFDRVSLSSLNRHAVATRRDVGLSKVAVCAEHFRAINPRCQIDVRDTMYTADASPELLQGPPQVVVDCIDDLATKADLLTACVAQGIPCLSALGSGAKSDALSLCVVEGLQDIENDPLATKLRKIFSTRPVDVSAITFVYSTQKPQRKLLPLSDEQRAAPEEFGNVANFRLRVIPVMGSQPAAEGIVLGMQTLQLLKPSWAYCPRPVAAPRRPMVERYLEELRQREKADVNVTVSEASFIVQEAWHGRSAFSGPGRGTGAATGQHLTLARWDPELPLDAGNIVLVSDQEAASHQSPHNVDAKTRERIEHILDQTKQRLGQLQGVNPAIFVQKKDGAGAAEQRYVWEGTEARDADAEALIAEQLSRSSAFFGTEGQTKVSQCFVVVVGLGALGSAAASMLARAGIKKLRLVDGATYSVGSCHAVSEASDAGIPKVEACRRKFQTIFPHCKIETITSFIDSSDLLAAPLDGQKPSLILECTSSLHLKRKVLRAAAAADIPVITATVTGSTDPTRITVAPLKDVYASPAAVRLRLSMDKELTGKEKIDVVHTQEAHHWMQKVELSCGLVKLFSGTVVAAVALCRLTGETLPEAQPPGLMSVWKKLRRACQQKYHPMDIPDTLALGCLAEQLWRGRCVLSDTPGTHASTGLCLTKWDVSKPVSLDNLVLMTEEEAAAHDSAAEKTGSLPEDVLDELERSVDSRRVQVHRILEHLNRHLEGSPDPPHPGQPCARRHSSGVTWHSSRIPSSVFCGLAGSLCLGLALGLRPSTRQLQWWSRVSALSLASAIAVCGAGQLWRRSLTWHPLPDSQHSDGEKRKAGFSGLVGNTPLIELRSLSQATGCRILAKAEFLNPGGCQKDRAALHIIAAAEHSGSLRPGGTIVEGTSGSTGISLSLAAAERGYSVHIVMPDDQASEKVALIERFGAKVELVRPASITSPEHYVNIARSRAAELNDQPESRGAIFADQFENLANLEAHFKGTGPEIWAQCDRSVDAFVMSAGTGGTISGVGSFLKSVCPDVHVCLVDVAGSSLYNKVVHGVLYTGEQAERTTRRHRTDTIAEGIGIDRLTLNLAQGLPTHNGGKPCIDDAVKVSDQEALDMAHHLLSHEGIFIGSSAAVNCAGAVKVARRLGPGHTVVTILCDNGLRHLTKFYNPSAWADFGLTPPQEHERIDLSFIS